MAVKRIERVWAPHNDAVVAPVTISFASIPILRLDDDVVVTVKRDGNIPQICTGGIRAECAFRRPTQSESLEEPAGPTVCLRARNAIEVHGFFRYFIPVVLRVNL